MTAPTGPGDFQALNEGDGESKNWFEQAAGRGSSAVGAAQDLADASSPPEWGAAVVSARMEQLELLSSPGQSLMSNGLGFLVSIVLSPLIEIAEYAIGDPEQMRSTGEGWEQVATWLDEVGEQEKRRAEATAAGWQGADGDAFRKQMTEFGDGVTALAADVRDLKGTLDMIADIFDMFVEFVIQIITELVIGLIVQWLAALAASWITAGASVATAGTTTTVQVGSTGMRITMRVSKLQMQLAKLVQRMEDLLKNIRQVGRLRSVIDQANGLRNGGQVAQFVGRRLDANPVFNTLTRANEDLATTASSRFLQGSTGAEALAGNLSQRFLSGALGGQMRWGGAIFEAGMTQATDAAIGQGADIAYGTGESVATGEPGQDERQNAQERGFS
ncbi:WXG100 family type VII secretion target [Saccharopolyspora sp. CA-218241]|uniref:WXG100 family type VII secretion target n=1 Tax=Saccharopolyspora sp. CA-218241 TaxID=3240027 RepID=UPI003D970F86